MKKIISCFLIFLFFFSSSALADDFTLHNGVKFGMSAETVLNTERSKGFRMDSSIYGEGQIAGFDGAVRYEYTDDKVTKCAYFYYTASPSSYSKLSEGLAKKYGPPSCSSVDMSFYPVNNTFTLSSATYGIYDAETLPLTCKSLENQIYQTRRTSDRNFFYMAIYECPLYEQWLIPQEDGSAVLIDHTYLADNTLMMDNKTGKAAFNAEVETTYYELIIYSLINAEDVEMLQENINTISDDL